MDRGTYAAASAGLVQLRKLDTITNNLANVNTAGFKRQLLVTDQQSFDATLAKAMEPSDPYARGDHQRTPNVGNITTRTDFSLGSIKETGNPLDVALRSPNDFFVINTPEGPRYTRAGNFTLSAEGALVTQDGFEVMGDGGPIAVNGAGANISAGGSVRAGGQEVGRVQVVRIEKPEELERIGDSRFKLRDGQPQPEAVEGDVVPSALEMANVSVVSGMVDMISANRAFEMYTRSAQTIDQMNQTAINQVGRTK